MLQFFTNTKYDFMSMRRLGYAVSALLVLTSFATIGHRWFTKGVPFVYGIDFSGGSQFEVKFVAAPDLNELRSRLDAAGFKSANLQSFGGADAAAVIVRLNENLEQDSTLVRRVRLALHSPDERAQDEAGLIDLNTVDPKDLARLLQTSIVEGDPGLSLDPVYVAVGDAIVAMRDKIPSGLFDSVATAAATDGVSEAMRDVLEAKAFTGSLTFLKTESVGPVVGKDLRAKALLASIVANGLILLYLSVRFELRFGVAAVLCLLHDAIVAVGALSATGREFDLTVLAAVLTVIGYSVNDTIVIFDRIRSNLKTMKRESLVTVINLSVNQMLARTLLTTGFTLLVVFPLYLFGGAALNNFAFILLVGMIVGTFSTTFIASPLLLIWQRFFPKI